jgi:hypothetical protein
MAIVMTATGLKRIQSGTTEMRADATLDIELHVQVLIQACRVGRCNLPVDPCPVATVGSGTAGLIDKIFGFM